MNLIWTKEKCREEALKYKNRKDFQDSSRPAYNSAWRNNWLDEICGHMVVRGNLLNRAIYSFEFSDNKVYIGLTYDLNKRKNEHLADPKSAVFIHMSKSNLIPIFKQLSDYLPLEYSKKMEGIKTKEYKDNNWVILNRKIHGDVGASLLKWDYDSCKEEAMKYSDRTSFSRNSSGAYKSATINGWLDDITKHMAIKMKKKYWTKDKCHIEALKYDTKNKFKINSCDAYTFAYRNGFLDEICSHMKKFHKGFRGYKKNESIMKKIKSYNLFLESSNKYGIHDWIEDLKSWEWSRPQHQSVNKDSMKKWSDRFIGEGWYDKISNYVDRIFEAFTKVDEEEIHMRMYDVYDQIPSGKDKWTMCCVAYGDVENYDKPLRNKYNGLITVRNKDEKDKLRIIVHIIKDIVIPTFSIGSYPSHFLRQSDESYYVTEPKWQCQNFNIDDFQEMGIKAGASFDTDDHKGRQVTISQFDIEKKKKYDINKIIEMYVPSVVIEIGNRDNSIATGGINLKKMELMLDEALESILPTLDYKEVVFDHARFDRGFSDETNIYDYTIKILLNY